MRRISGCLTKLVLWAGLAVVVTWALMVVLHPWALHIGGRSAPLLYWHGAGTVVAERGKARPLYVSFWPGPHSDPVEAAGGRAGSSVHGCWVRAGSALRPVRWSECS